MNLRLCKAHNDAHTDFDATRVLDSSQSHRFGLNIVTTACLTLLFSLSLSLSAPAQDPAGLREAIDADYESHLWPLFNHWHRNLELSLIETKTAARLAKELRDTGFKVREGVGGTGGVVSL